MPLPDKCSDGSETSASLTCTRAALARFTGSHLDLAANRTRGSPALRRPGPAEALAEPEEADATSNSGHIETGANVAGFHDHKVKSKCRSPLNQ